MILYKTNKKYDFYKKPFKGVEITFRVHRKKQTVEFLVDDNFVRANGYKSKTSLPVAMQKQLEACFGNSEAWLEFNQEIGDFIAYPLSMKN